MFGYQRKIERLLSRRLSAENSDTQPDAAVVRKRLRNALRDLPDLGVNNAEPIELLLGTLRERLVVALEQLPKDDVEVFVRFIHSKNWRHSFGDSSVQDIFNMLAFIYDMVVIELSECGFPADSWNVLTTKAKKRKADLIEERNEKEAASKKKWEERSVVWGHLWLHGVILAMLGLAFVEWDEYGFYVLLRFVCCASFGRWALLSFEKESTRWGWLWGMLAVSYNPFIPLHLGRDVWEIVNMATIAVVMVDAIRLFRRERNSGKLGK